MRKSLLVLMLSIVLVMPVLAMEMPRQYQQLFTIPHSEWIDARPHGKFVYLQYKIPEHRIYLRAFEWGIMTSEEYWTEQSDGNYSIKVIHYTSNYGGQLIRAYGYELFESPDSIVLEFDFLPEIDILTTKRHLELADFIYNHYMNKDK
jgi:hypothetical protein